MADDNEHSEWAKHRRRFYGTSREEREEQNRHRFERRRQQWEQATNALFEAMSDGYKATIKEIDSAGHFFRQKAADILEPRLNEELRAHPSGTFGEKNKLAAWINEDVARLGLSLYSSNTQNPGMLAVEKTKDGSGRFRYDSRRLTAGSTADSRGYYHTLESFDDLTGVRLIPASLDHTQWDRWTKLVMKERVKNGPSPGAARSG